MLYDLVRKKNDITIVYHANCNDIVYHRITIWQATHYFVVKYSNLLKATLSFKISSRFFSRNYKLPENIEEIFLWYF